MHHEHHGMIYAVFGAALAAVMAALVRLAADIPVATILFARFFICALTTAPYIYLKKVIITEKSVRKHCFRAILGLASMGCFFYSINHLTIMNAVTLSNTAPLFLPVVIFFWLRKIIPLTRFFALLFGFVGVVVILRPSPDMDIWAALIGLLGGLCIALVQIGIRQLSTTESTETIMTHYFAISTVLSLFPMIYFWKPIAEPKLWLYVLLIGIVSLLYQYCFTKSLGSARATKVSAVNYLAVPFGGLLGWWLFQEVPSFWVLVGTCLIICGGVIALLSKQESRHRG